MELIIFSGVVALALIVLIIYRIWSDRTYTKYMEEISQLHKQLEQVLKDFDEQGELLDETQKEVEKMGREIELLRSALSLNGKKITFEN